MYWLLILFGILIFLIDTPAEITNFTEDYSLDPRLGLNHVKVLKDYFIREFGFKVSHSRLYSDLTRKPINLTESD